LLLLQKRFVFRYLAVSRTVEESLEEQGIKKNVSVVYNGVPRQTTLEKKINTTEPFRILAIAYPVPHKGAHHLLEVLTLLKNEISFKCSLLGWYSESLDPIYHDHILNEIKHRGLGSMVEVFGNVEAIGEWYKSSDVLVHPSESESFGFTVAEAMSYGLPVVAFDVGALYELIDDKINGYLVPPFDYVKMVEIIKKLKEESELAILIGKAAQEKIKKKFTLEDTMLRVFNIMELLQYIVFFYVLNR
jgi:glycosyltransferase involved in cell wall biosynthesis